MLGSEDRFPAHLEKPRGRGLHLKKAYINTLEIPPDVMAEIIGINLLRPCQLQTVTIYLLYGAYFVANV